MIIELLLDRSRTMTYFPVRIVFGWTTSLVDVLWPKISLSAFLINIVQRFFCRKKLPDAQLPGVHSKMVEIVTLY